MNTSSPKVPMTTFEAIGKEQISNLCSSLANLCRPKANAKSLVRKRKTSMDISCKCHSNIYKY